MKATKIVLLFPELLYILYILIGVSFLLNKKKNNKKKKKMLSLRTEIYKSYHHKIELLNIMEPFAQER